MKYVLLDFNTIINPASLLSCLITFRQTHEKIYVRAESLIYMYYDKSLTGQQGGEFSSFGRMSDLSALDAAEIICKRSREDLSLVPSNLCLAIKLLQHAINEKIITVLDDTLGGNWSGGEQYMSIEELRQIPSFGYIDQHIYSGGKYGNVILTTDMPQKYNDLTLSLHQGWDTSIGGRSFSATDLIKHSKGTPSNVGYESEVIPILKMDKLLDYLILIDNPNMLPSIARAAKTLIEEEDYKKKVRLFLPKFFVGKMTLGASSLIEMLWIIFKHEKNSKKD